MTHRKDADDFVARFKAAQKIQADLLAKFSPNEAAKQARLRMIAAAEQTLRRPLTQMERHAVKGYWLGPALAFEQDFLHDPPEKTEQHFNEVLAATFESEFIQKLGRSKKDVSEEWTQFLKLLEPHAVQALAKLDLSAEIQQFSDWLENTLAKEKPPQELRVIYFQLAEFKDGFRGCLIGARSRSELAKNSEFEWAPNEEYRFARSHQTLWKQLAKAKLQPWWFCVALAVLIARQYFRANASRFQKRSGLKDVRFVTGFPDGDLFGVTKVATR